MEISKTWLEKIKAEAEGKYEAILNKDYVNRMISQTGETKPDKPLKTSEAKIGYWDNLFNDYLRELKANAQEKAEEKINEFKDSNLFKFMENKGLRLREYMINAIEKENIQNVTDSLDLTDYVNGNEKITNQIKDGTPMEEKTEEPPTEYTEVNPPRAGFDSAKKLANIVVNKMIEGQNKNKDEMDSNFQSALNEANEYLKEINKKRRAIYVAQDGGNSFLQGINNARGRASHKVHEKAEKFKDQAKEITADLNIDELAQKVAELFAKAYMNGINNARAKGEEFKEQTKDIVTNLPDYEIIKYAINEANEWLSNRINDRELINNIKESLDPYLRGLRNGSKKRFDKMIEIEEEIANRTNEEEKTAKVISFELGTANLEVSDNQSLLEKINEIKRELKDTENANNEKEMEIAGKQGEAVKNIKKAQAQQEENRQKMLKIIKRDNKKLEQAKETSKSLKSRDEEVQRILDESEAQLEEANKIKTALKAA